ncbi:MAG: hypothetical protein KY475_04320 [Planctomycetes bacterium]|nr:hypothetical protein [Planctomycetota bacterium]
MKRRKSESRAVCPECGGSGKYVGLTVVEACRGCGGTGRLSPPRVDVIKSRVLDHRLFELVLGKQGFLVSTFDSVGNYLHNYETPPDCIIVGWFFRTLGVAELLADLEERGDPPPVIVSTTLALERDELPSGVFALVADHALGSEEYLQVIKSAIAHRKLADGGR